MSLADYNDVVERLQRGLTGMERDDAASLAVHRIDPEYYLVEIPAFYLQLSRLTGLEPKAVREALVRTGNLVSREQGRYSAVRVRLLPQNAQCRDVTVGFLDAAFLDRAFEGSGEAAKAPAQLASIRIHAAERPKVEAFFAGRVPPASLAYGALAA